MSAGQLDSAIAVIGMACRFPGAPDVQTFWRNLCAGVSAVRRFDVEELRRAGVAEELLRSPSFVPACAPLTDPYAFDASYFGIASAPARVIDPQQRVFLECAWTALEASGALAARNSVIAVFAGASDPAYSASSDGLGEGQGGRLAADLGASSDYLAARVAFLLNLRGPAVAVRAACASSLLAIHLAVQSLLTHECDVAAAGGAAVRHPTLRGHLYEPGGIYSQDGLCRPYDRLGSGIVSGDGAGVIVLRRLEDALICGDPVHAVLRGSAVTNDGARKASFTSPSIEGQVQAAVNALEVAGVDPVTIGFIEGHGTATPLGDPLEVEALRRAWGSASARRSCVLGSVKSSIGHLDAAAGVAGVIKACLAVEHGVIPGTLNFSEPNPHAGLEDSPFLVSAEAVPWNGSRLRRASVHGLGLGGTNVHVVLEQPPAPATRHSATLSSIPVALTLSTRRPEAMTRYADALATELDAAEDDVAVAAHTLHVGRVIEPYRRVAVGLDALQLSHELRCLKEPTRAAAAHPRLILVFPGDGRRLPAGLSQLADHLPPVAATLRAAADHLRGRWSLDLERALHAIELSPPGIIPALVAQGVALHAALERFGAGGDLVVGQSLGELTAAVASGLLGLEDALDLAVAREHAFRSVVPSGAMAIHLSPTALLARLPKDLELSLVNSPSRCVVSGNPEALARFAAELEADDIPVQRLELISAVHSSLLDPTLHDFRRAAERLRPRAPSRTLLSSVGPSAVDAAITCDPDHWVRQLRQPVRFDLCLDTAVASQPDVVVLDVSPHGGLTAAIHETVGAKIRGLVRIAPHGTGTSELEALAAGLGTLWEHGVSIDWDAWPRRAARRMSLPVQPLARTVLEPVHSQASARSKPSPAGGVRLWARNWRRARPAPATLGLVGRVLILAGADPFAHELGSWVARLGHRVEVIARAARAQLDEPFDVLIDARALGESNAPTAIATFLETAADAVRRSPMPSRMVVLTRGAYEIVGTEVLSPGAAGLACASLVVAQEHGDLGLTCLDLATGSADPETVARVITSEARTGVLIAVRGRSVWRPVLEPLPMPTHPRDAGRVDGPCIVLGAHGRFGRWLGRWLASHGSPDLFLASRGGVGSRSASDAIEAMQQTGARVVVLHVDVERRASLFEALDAAQRSAGPGHPLTIFHLAGAPHAASACAPLVDLARGDLLAALEQQWAGKVVGAENILEWTRRHPETRCVAFSSNAAVLGGPGLAAYAAANAALDILAVSAREREGLAWSSVGWDGWRLADDEPGAVRSALEAFALRDDEPWEALQDALALQQAHLIVAKGDFLDRHRTWVEELSPGDTSPRQWSRAMPNLRPTSAHELRTAVRQIWSDVLGSVPEHDDVNLFEVGGDSLTAMRIRTRIENALGIQLTLPEVLKHRTIAGLVALVGGRASDLEARTGAEGASDPGLPPQTLRGRI